MQDPGKSWGLLVTGHILMVPACWPSKLEAGAGGPVPRNASLAGSDCVWSSALGEARVRGLCGYGVARDMRAVCMRGCRHARRYGSRQK